MPPVEKKKPQKKSVEARPIETLTLRNFAGITEATIELDALTVLIGPQASGKSVCAKLFYFLKELPNRVILGLAKRDSIEKMRRTEKVAFQNMFPPMALGKEDYEVEYRFGGFSVRVSRSAIEGGGAELEFSEPLERALALALERLGLQQRYSLIDQDPTLGFFAMLSAREALRATSTEVSMLSPRLRNFLIPAGRSFFATLQSSIFGLISGGAKLDPFVIEFGRLYEEVRRDSQRTQAGEGSLVADFARRCTQLIKGEIEFAADGDFVRAHDGRRVPMLFASSGQQELVPLLAVLVDLYGEDAASAFSLFIEEPEAHIFPTAQQALVKLIATVARGEEKSPRGQLFITTHSPYILTAINNLMFAQGILERDPAKGEAVVALMGTEDFLAPSGVRAYHLADGKATSILDPETGLILAEAIDDVSGDLAEEFDALLDLEYGDG